MKKFILYTFIALASIFLLSAIFFTARQGIANLQIESEWQSVPNPAPRLAATSKLEIIPIYENDRAGDNLNFGHGVSYLVRTDSATVLLDLGHNPSESAQLPALENLHALGIPWEEIDSIVISHPHPDHVGGVKAWQNKTVSLGDLAGDLGSLSIYTPVSMTYPGAVTVNSDEPTRLSQEMGTTGVITFPEVFPISLFDPKGHEQGLVVDVAGEGLVLITGCGHPSLEKLVARAESLYGGRVVGVVGGLHYGSASPEDVQPHIQFLESRQPTLVALSPHDSDPTVIEAFSSAFPEAYQPVRVGQAIQFPKSK